MIKVCKFGGSSLSEAKQFEKVRDIVLSDERRAVVVVSAPGKRFSGDNKITDLLYLCHSHLQYGVSYEPIFQMVEERYREIAKSFGLKQDLEADFREIRSHMKKGMSIDYLASRGEYLNAKLMAEYLGYAFVDAADFLFFDFEGRVDYEKTNAALKEAMLQHGRLVLPGFYGSMPDGRIRTLSRGGSDVTGAIAAAAIDAGLYENWTDVSGILMADPRIVKDPKSIPFISYSELRELSYMGAAVLHEETVFPVRAKNIPINIRNTNDPEAPGTIIQESFMETEAEGSNFITGISGKQHYAILSITKSRSHGGGIKVIRKALEIVERFGVEIEHLPCGIDNFSMVFSMEKVQNCILDMITEIKRICEPDEVKFTENISLIAVVGRRMAYKPGVSGKLFGTLGDNNINIRMIEQGADEINITVGVEDHNFEKTIQVLYHSFT